MINRKVYQLISAILFAFSLSILMGQFSPVKAQANESQEFFEVGEQEFEQEAEKLEEQQEPNSQPQLTIDEDPSEVEEVPTRDQELRLNDNMPEQPTNEEIKIKFWIYQKAAPVDLFGKVEDERQPSFWLYI